MKYQMHLIQGMIESKFQLISNLLKKIKKIYIKLIELTKNQNEYSKLSNIIIFINQF